MKAKKLLKISGIAVLSLVLLVVALWYSLPLLPVAPQVRMTRELLVQMTRNEEQLAALPEKSDTAYHHMQVVRQSFVPLGIRLMGPDPGIGEIAPLLPDMVRLFRAMARTDESYSHFTKPENGWRATAPAVEPDTRETLMRDTETFLRQAAEAADMQTQYAACATLALRWIPAHPQNEEQEKQMAGRTMAMLPAARPLIIRALDAPVEDNTVEPMMQALPVLHALYREVLKNDTPRLQKLLAELVQLDTSTLDTLRTVNDAPSAQAAAEKLLKIGKSRSCLFTRLAPLLLEGPEIPELQKLNEISPEIEKRAEELRKLPEPFYGCDELAELLSWG